MQSPWESHQQLARHTRLLALAQAQPASALGEQLQTSPRQFGEMKATRSPGASEIWLAQHIWP